MRNGEHISVVIPARNEEAGLAMLLPRIPDWVDRVVVADNGSADRTASFARSLGAEVVHVARRGYGAACWSGAERALTHSTDVLVFMDADGSDAPEEMARLVDPLLDRSAQLVIGCRSAGSAMPPHQRMGTGAVCALLSLGFGVTIGDLGPFRAIDAASYQTLRMRDRAFGWTAEMQARALRFGLEMREVEVSWRPGLGRSEITGSLPGALRAGRDLTMRASREIAASRIDRLMRRGER